MRRSIHIVLVCLLALQPLMPLWAAAGSDCEMASMHDAPVAAAAPCEHCTDCAGESDCAALCQAVFSSPMVLIDVSISGHPIPAVAQVITESDRVPAGHSSPALRPPISH